VGGLPQSPSRPLNYQIVYSLEGALDYYTTPSWVLPRAPRACDALSELEDVAFRAQSERSRHSIPVAASPTMPWAYEGQVRTMEYKTLRYPGHVAIMRPIREMGLLSVESR